MKIVKDNAQGVMIILPITTLTSYLFVFVANNSRKGTKAQSKTLDARIYRFDNSLKLVIRNL